MQIACHRRPSQGTPTQEPFPGETVRTLDAIHLVVLSADERARANASQLGFRSQS